MINVHDEQGMKFNELSEELKQTAFSTLMLKCVAKEFQYYKFSEDAINALVFEVISIHSRFVGLKNELRSYEDVKDVPAGIAEELELPKYVTFQEIRMKMESLQKTGKKRKRGNV